MKTTQLLSLLTLLLLGLASTQLAAKPRVAVLAFELKDVTLTPSIPAEIARTASIKPALENELIKSGYELVEINLNAQQLANAGVGYLFEHADAAAQLGKQYGADYVVVGRLHKPSFLFFYLIAHLVNVKQATLAGDYLYEVKGGEKKLVAHGVAGLAEKITHTLSLAK